MQYVVERDLYQHLQKLDVLWVSDFITERHIKSKVNNIMSGNDIAYFDNIAGDMTMEQVTLYDKLTIEVAFAKTPGELHNLQKQLNELLREVIEMKVRKESKSASYGK